MDWFTAAIDTEAALAVHDREGISRRHFIALAGEGALGLTILVACGTGPTQKATPTSSPLSEDLWRLSLEDAARLVSKKQVSPVELTQQMLDRIERLEPKLNAFITLTAERALTRARVAEKEIAAGSYRSPLHGIPIAHKDLFDTRGVRTTAGSKILADNVPDHDATIVARLIDAGAVTLGKLNMWEFASAISGTNPHYGPVHNPWNLQQIPGGTSAGSAAATAAGLVYAATGSDTGGSIRGPSSYCGVVGLMPTYGRVSMYGGFPASKTLDHAGPIARRVRDAAIVLQAIAGRDPRDPAAIAKPVPDYLAQIEQGPKHLRIGIPRHHFWEGLDAGVERMVQKAIDDLEAAGAEVREVPYAQADEYYDAWRIIAAIETGMSHAATYPSRKAEYGRDLAALLQAVQGSPSQLEESLQKPMAVLERARGGEADQILDGVDVLAMPTQRQPPYSIAEAERLYERADLSELEAKASAQNVAVIDLTGQPAISVPCGRTPDGLPVGLMLVARQWDEPTLLRAARAYEQVRGTFPMPPV